MKAIGVRELKAGLSRYLRDVAAGEVVQMEKFTVSTALGKYAESNTSGANKIPARQVHIHPYRLKSSPQSMPAPAAPGDGNTG